MVTSTDGTWSGKGSFIGAGSTALVENTHRLTKGLGGRTGKGREEYEGKGDSVVQVGAKETIKILVGAKVGGWGRKYTVITGLDAEYGFHVF